MNLPGSRQVALGKKLLEQYAWQDFQPHPEWAAFTAKSSVSLAGCQWIWFPEGNPAQNAPAAKRFFRRTFVLPEGKAIKNAQLRISVDDKFAARLNGGSVGASDPGSETWRTAKQFDNIGRLLKPGTNVLAVVGENSPAGGANPAGLIARMEIQFAGGELLAFTSDATWRCATNELAGWDSGGFDDAAWAKAIVIGRHGDSPWGQIDQTNNDDVYGPQSAGIPGVVRIIYVPEGEAIVVRNLEKQATYAATYFDPVSGAKTKLAAIQADDNGLWECPAPRGNNHDWVLILEAKTKAVSR
jgi:hypothetical protein